MREAIGNVYLARGQTAAAQEAMKAALAIREQADDTRNGIWYALTMFRLADAMQSDATGQSAQLRQRAMPFADNIPPVAGKRQPALSDASVTRLSFFSILLSKKMPRRGAFFKRIPFIQRKRRPACQYDSAATCFSFHL
jgi:hypothetical protein